MSEAYAWQYLVKLRKRGSSSASPLKISSSETTVVPISLETATSFIEEYEWLGNVGSAQRCYGLYCGKRLLAVACFTRATSPVAFARLWPNLCRKRLFQLCRGATDPFAPKWAASRVISGSLKLLRKQVGAELVLAYADPRAGEIGVVYQAANAFYLGLTDARGPGEYVIRGVRMHPRTVFRRFGTAAHDILVKIDPEYTRIQRAKKHRYAFILAKGRRRSDLLGLLTPLVRPPPKRKISGEHLPLSSDMREPRALEAVL